MYHLKIAISNKSIVIKLMAVWLYTYYL